VKITHRLILFLLVYSFSFSAKSQIIDTAWVGSERNYSTLGAPNSTYIWGADEAVFLSNTALPSVSVRWNEPAGIKPIWVIEVSEFGCFSDTLWAYVYLVEKDTFYVANAFTPDSDGLNDVFSITFNPKHVLSYVLRVYNRWGIMVFESTDPTQGWDGNFLNSACESGMYIWHLQVDKSVGKSFYKKGTVKIIR
jgi:gliding motility-associated-like protein